MLWAMVNDLFPSEKGLFQISVVLTLSKRPKGNLGWQFTQKNVKKCQELEVNSSCCLM